MPELNDTGVMTLDVTAAGLAEGDLVLRSATLQEALSQPFEIDLLALALPGTTIDLDALLGKPMTLSLELPDGSQRPFHGQVASAGLHGSEGSMVVYRLVLRPWLWLLTRRRDTRIFQNMALQDVLSQVFAPYTPAVEFSGVSTNPNFEYCVQYRETDFDFVSRLMEREGLYYFFSHSDSAHTMTIVDAMSAHTAAAGFASFNYRSSVGALVDLEAITGWRTQREIQPGKVSLTDFDFKRPATSLLKSASSTLSNAQATLEVYEQPGAYVVEGEGERYAGLRMQEHQARYCRVEGSGNVRALAVGRRFTLADHPLDSECAEHVAVATRIEYERSGYEAGQSRYRFQCDFNAMRAADVYRPPRIAPRPLATGPQPAIVVGPSGDEIHTDEHGRVKVFFPWDRIGSQDETASCWVRVSQPMAGSGWGSLSLPRIGQEVIVEFVGGDPDQPIIVGRVYNGQNAVPYTLPDNKTVSVARSNSSTGGGGMNELRFEDKAGSEHVLFHAQKDYFHLVKNDSRTLIEHDEFRTVKNNSSEEIKVDAHRKVGGKQLQEIVGDTALKVGGKSATKVEGNVSMKAGGDLVSESGGALSFKVGSQADMKISSNLGIEAGANVHIKAGANLVIEAGAELTLKGAMIVLDASGIITIKGSMVNINSGGSGGGGSGASPKTPDAPDAPTVPDAPTDPLDAY